MAGPCHAGTHGQGLAQARVSHAQTVRHVSFLYHEAWRMMETVLQKSTGTSRLQQKVEWPGWCAGTYSQGFAEALLSPSSPHEVSCVASASCTMNPEQRTYARPKSTQEHSSSVQ